MSARSPANGIGNRPTDWAARQTRSCPRETFRVGRAPVGPPAPRVRPAPLRWPGAQGKCPAAAPDRPARRTTSRYSRLRRRARPGESTTARPQRRNAVGRSPYCARPASTGPTLEISSQVERKAIVIVDQHNHGSRELARASTARNSPSALCQVSSYSRLGSDWATMPPPTGNCHQPRPAVMVRIKMFSVQRAVEAQIAERPTIRAAGGRFQLGDDLHGPDLRRAGDRTAGKCGPHQIQRRAPSASVPHDDRHQVQHDA